MRLTINGRARELDIPANETLLDVLRDRLHLTGTKLVCDRGECGACTVLLARGDRSAEPVYSCLTLAVACDGDAVTTVEGLSTASELHPVQQAFISNDAVQCGYCTPGQVLAAVALLSRNTEPTDDEIDQAMSGNLCRCGTYPKIRLAIRDAADAMRGGNGA
jgi:aerobic-type carbon monoxide dehydrogenase small subunit (CoxS/CutS family)